MNTKLKKAVLKQIGVTEKEFTQNVSNYFNAQNGVSGFIYYSDTHAFALKNQKLINELLQDCADSLDENVVDMVSNFGVFRAGIDQDELKDLYRFLSEVKNPKKYETNSVLNVLAWFCVEQLAFELDN
jgi:hypothetical protein